MLSTKSFGDKRTFAGKQQNARGNAWRSRLSKAGGAGSMMQTSGPHRIRAPFKSRGGGRVVL